MSPRASRWRRRTALALLLACLAYLTRHLGDRWFYWPDAVDHPLPAGFAGPDEVVEFAAPGGPRLVGWWLRAHGSARGTVVYCHGNHANIRHHVRFVTWLPERGFDLLLFDYRGYGQSAGSPTREGTVADAVAAIDLALQRDPERTVVFGHSLGGAIGLVAAARRPSVRALIVEATFPSYRAAACCTVPVFAFLVPWLVSSGSDPVDALPFLTPRPLLIVHGTADRVAPLELGRALFAAAREPRRMLEVAGAGHETPWVTQGRAFADQLESFLVQALARR